MKWFLSAVMIVAAMVICVPTIEAGDCNNNLQARRGSNAFERGFRAGANASNNQRRRRGSGGGGGGGTTVVDTNNGFFGIGARTRVITTN